MLKNLLIKKLTDKEYFLLGFIIFLTHLLTINFYPTNFEGAYLKLSHFFFESNKLFLIDSFYNVQANTIIFSIIASLISKLFIVIEPEIAIRLLSASSYFFLIYSFKNLLKFLEIEKFLFFFILLISNPLIWYYGHRAYVDLFSFSIGLYGFSLLLNNIENKQKIILSIFCVTLAILLKPFNLVFIPIIFTSFIFIFNIKFDFSKIFILFFPILIFLVFLFINKYFFGFYLIPDKFISDGSIFIKLKKINYDYFISVLSNFVYYLGYLGIITCPLLFKFSKEILKEGTLLRILLIILVSFFLSKILSSNYGEINLGPIQTLINIDLYKFIICLSFNYIIYLIFSIKEFVPINVKLNKVYFYIFIILFYLFILSFLKLSQRYILLIIPFFYCLVFILQNSKMVFMLNFIINIFIITLLLVNYNIQSKLSSSLFNTMKKRNILFQTHPGPLLPHLMHEYQHLKNFKKNKLMHFDDNILYKISYEIPNNKLYETFSYNLFGKVLKKIYLIKNN